MRLASLGLGPIMMFAAPGHPDRAVLVVEATWAKSAFRTEHVGGSMLVELAVPIRIDEAVRVDAQRRNEYVEGSMAARRTRLEGTITPLAVNVERVELFVDDQGLAGCIAVVARVVEHEVHRAVAGRLADDREPGCVVEIDDWRLEWSCDDERATGFADAIARSADEEIYVAV